MYKCYSCEKSFNEPEDQTEKDRKAEYEKNFGDRYKDDELVLTCDECYEGIINSDPVLKSQKELLKNLKDGLDTIFTKFT